MLKKINMYENWKFHFFQFSMFSGLKSYKINSLVGSKVTALNLKIKRSPFLLATKKGKKIVRKIGRPKDFE